MPTRVKGYTTKKGKHIRGYTRKSRKSRTTRRKKR